MYASTILTLGLSALAAAAPTTSPEKTSHKKSHNAFEISKFTYGCTGSCYWAFDVAIKGSANNHPAIDTPVHCSGGLNEDTNYVQCGNVSDTQSIEAYVVKATNELKLKYVVTPIYTEPGAVYSYYGNTTVYAVTGPDADKQKPEFEVKETSATAVA